MTFVKASFAHLMAIGTRGAYAGASNQTSASDFQTYILGKTSYGTCDADSFRYCYYAWTRNALAAEDKLLERGFECNIQDLSNVQGSPGFVYVCTKGQRAFMWTKKRA